MTKFQSFSLQNPEWYNSIYRNKNYRSEAKYFLKIYNSIFKKKPYILDVGSGTGNLIPFLKPYSSKYIALEPYNKFNNYLKNKFKNEKYLEINNLNFQDYVRIIDPKVNLILANFNVLNYLKYKEFLDCLKTLQNSLKKGTVFIFDTWSLDFVRSNNSSLKNYKLIEEENLDKGEYKDFAIIRFGNSNFKINNNTLDLDFNFIAVNEKEYKNLGTEKHRIYPFCIKTFLKDIETFDWSIINLQEYGNLMSNKISKEKSNDYSLERNWFISLILK